eukprot:gb/GECG01013152.1/.p1 GENE.gb/GECG01013152.1/~~gb/GECG01013152.1/.p1  ORF type:complete len:136 (+),score=12.09 gb/GECG01013152.1/:1-408(+)
MATSEDPLSSHTAADGHDGKEEDEFAGAASALMVVETGPSKGLTFSVSQAREIRIGRDKKCEASISDNTISRTHGVLRINEDGTTVFTDSSRMYYYSACTWIQLPECKKIQSSFYIMQETGPGTSPKDRKSRHQL